MKHAIKHKKLNRDSAHRIALFKNMTDSLVKFERIKTTLPKAKSLRPYVEKLVTLSKRNNLASRRKIGSKVFDLDTVRKLMDDLSIRYKDRAGGYTRILKLGQRKGDASPMAYIEFVFAKKEVVVSQNKQSKPAKTSKVKKQVESSSSLKKVDSTIEKSSKITHSEEKKLVSKKSTDKS